MKRQEAIEDGRGQVRGPYRDGSSWSYKFQNDDGNWYIHESSSRTYQQTQKSVARKVAEKAVRSYLEGTGQLEDVDAPNRLGQPDYDLAIMTAVDKASPGRVEERFRGALECLGVE